MATDAAAHHPQGWLGVPLCTTALATLVPFAGRALSRYQSTIVTDLVSFGRTGNATDREAVDATMRVLLLSVQGLRHRPRWRATTTRGRPN